jgi:hypothetical protein
MGKPHAPLAAAVLTFGVGQHATLTAKGGELTRGLSH